MANKQLFSTAQVTTHVNAAGGKAYALEPREALAQLAVTGCLSDVWYANASTQLDEVLALCAQVEPAFVARAAVHARRHGRMKDMPVLMLAWLSVHAPPMAEVVFGEIVDSVAQLRSYVQILRSGAVGKRSLASRPKRFVQAWLEAASDAQLVRGLVGNAPSLGDVIRLAHPRAASIERSALYAHAIGQSTRTELLPTALQALARFRADPTLPVPDVPFQMLTDMPLDASHWRAIAQQASWTTTRMNLNTFSRHGVFEDEAMVARVAERLRDRSAIQRARVFPYQLLAAWNAAQHLPQAILDALRDATTLATANVPQLAGSVAVAVDVSGSMASPITGVRRGATSVMRCVDVAGLVAASVLARNAQATVLPFAESVRPWARPRNGGVLETARALAAMLGGGTAISAPIVRLNQLGLAPDLVLIVSDNQSWAESQQHGASATAQAWAKLRRRNPSAKLVCLDLQPYASTPVSTRDGVLNIGGFSDAVFEVIASFVREGRNTGHWVRTIEETPLR